MTPCHKCGTERGSIRDFVNDRPLCGACSGYGDRTLDEPEPLTAEDVRAAKLDTDAHGRVFDEVKIAAAVQVLRSIRDEQPTASAVIRALAEATLEKLR